MEEGKGAREVGGWLLRVDRKVVRSQVSQSARPDQRSRCLLALVFEICWEDPRKIVLCQTSGFFGKWKQKIDLPQFDSCSTLIKGSCCSGSSLRIIPGKLAAGTKNDRESCVAKSETTRMVPVGIPDDGTVLNFANCKV